MQPNTSTTEIYLYIYFSSNDPMINRAAREFSRRPEKHLLKEVLYFFDYKPQLVLNCFVGFFAE